jgi:hypothetical protein
LVHAPVLAGQPLEWGPEDSKPCRDYAPNRMGGRAQLEADYLVVGAGALGMAFVDSLIGHRDADVIMVDRHHGPGGHWRDSYPFVQLHQPSRFYGVTSTPLDHNSAGRDGSADASDRASGSEICGYFDEIMRGRFVASGRVRFFPMCDYLGDHRFRSRVTGQESEVTVRGRLVDATYMASQVPATHPAPFGVADGVRMIPVGELAEVESPPAGIVIVGAGKTALDAICWLLDRGTDPEDITWIRPQDTWLLNREFFQPSQPRTFLGVILQLEAMAASGSVQETYERLEGQGLMLRTDRAVVPTMMKGATVSRDELDQLMRVRNIVRLGRVTRIETDRVVLERGEIPTSPDHVHVHCAAPGLSDQTPRAIFADDTITLQLVTRVGLTLSGALLGYLEASGRTTEEKNDLCPPTSMPHTPFDYLRAVLAGIRTEMGWAAAPELSDWLEGSRLNLMSGLADNVDPPTLEELQLRFFTALPPAFEKLETFASQATAQERRRMFEPSRSPSA